MPRHWKDEFAPSTSVSDMLQGYVEAFDPDFVTYIGCEPAGASCHQSRRVIDCDEIIMESSSLGTSPYGIGYFELARHVEFKEMRFKRQKPLHLSVPNFGRVYDTFLKSVVGSLPEDIADDVRQQLEFHYDAPQLTASINSFATCLDRSYLTPLRLVRHGLRPDRYAAAWDRNYVFYLDASNHLDVVDFWNLRALGFSVLPVPVQAKDQPSVHEVIEQFARDSHAVNRHNPSITYDVKFLKARSISQEEFEALIIASPVLKSLKDSSIKPLIQSWFPKFWSRWDREHNQCECVRFFGETLDSEVTAVDDTIRFKAIIPEFADDSAGGLSVANEIAFRTFDDGEPTAQVFPEATEQLGEAFRTLPIFGDWRFSSVGPVHFPRMSNQPYFGVPKAQALVEQWFVCDGWDVSTSPAGLAARELLKHLGGVHLASRIADEDVVLLLSELSKGKPITYKSLKSKAWQIARKRGLKSPNGIISTLMTSHLVQLGVQVKCTTCGRHPWYEMSEARPTVQCTECLRQLELPVSVPERIEWAYRGMGPLVSLSTSTGAFPVLLALRFLSLLMNVQLTPAFGVNISKEGQEFEIDLGGFWSESRFRRVRPRMILSECKSYNAFEDKDIRRLGILGSIYPGSLLVFATLRRELAPREKVRLAKLAHKGRGCVGMEEPANPLLVLTGSELFMNYQPTAFWSKQGGKYASLSKQLRFEGDLIGLCSITQQLYLDMPPMKLSV